jgi:RHS repeat-associated protein
VGGAWVTTYDGWREAVEHTVVPSSPAQMVPVKQFVHGSSLDEILAYRRFNGTSWEDYHILHGGQDTAAKLVNQSGQVVEQYEYDPFGKATVYTAAGALVDVGPAGTSPEDGTRSAYGLTHLYKAMRLDPETGNCYVRNRFYDPRTGRFMSRDPIGVWGDAGNMGNEYAYAWNRPLVVGDPLGLQAPPVPRAHEVPAKPDTTIGGSPILARQYRDSETGEGISEDKLKQYQDQGDKILRNYIDYVKLVDHGIQSVYYNCHSFTINNRRGWVDWDSVLIWLSQTATPRVTRPKKYDVVIYWGYVKTDLIITHSGYVCDVFQNLDGTTEVWVISKWGVGPLVKHRIGDVPPEYLNPYDGPGVPPKWDTPRIEIYEIKPPVNIISPDPWELPPRPEGGYA